MRYITAAGLLALCAGAFSDARAAMTVVNLSGGTVTVLEPDVLGTGKYRVTVNTGSDVSFTLRFNAGDIVEEIEIVPRNVSGTRVSVTVDGTIPDPRLFYGLQQIKRVVRGTGAGEVWITKVQANLIGDVVREPVAGGNPNPAYGQTSGLIKANHIGEVLAHWSILADIEAIGTSFPNLDNTIIDIVKADRDIAWFPEFALDGSILGDIRSNGGNIGTIDAAAFIGAVNNAASSNTQTIETGGGNIGSIIAGSLGEVTIDCLGSSNGQVNSIVTTVGGWGYDEGYETFLNDDIDFDPSGRPMGFTSGGSLIAGRLGALSLKGSLDSSLSIGSIVQSGTWKIGDSLGPNALISLRNGGLSGQIVINANGDDGEWLGAIRVAQTSSFTGPWYNLTDGYSERPSLLGGGSAGTVSYALHGNACYPAAGGSITIGTIDPWSIEIDPPCVHDAYEFKAHFYGNVSFVSGLSSDTSAVVLRKLRYQNGFPVNYGVVTLGQATVSGREIILRRPLDGNGDPVSFEPGYVYRLTILENKVKVSGADLFDSQQQILVEPVVYEFEAFDECESKFDLNGDGVLDSGDLAQWFVEPINLNNYPEVNIDDAATLQRGINEHGD